MILMTDHYNQMIGSGYTGAQAEMPVHRFL